MPAIAPSSLGRLPMGYRRHGLLLHVSCTFIYACIGLNLQNAVLPFRISLRT